MSIIEKMRCSFSYIICDSISCRGHQLKGFIRDHVVTLILKFLEEEKTETEAIYRGLVGLGNLVCFFSLFQVANN